MAIEFYWRFTRLCIPVLTASTAILLLGIVASTLMLPGSAVAIDLPASRWVRVDTKPDPMMENLRIPADAATSGMWSDVFSWPMNGLHSMVLPDGKVLTFGTISDGRAQDGRLFDVWDPSLGFGNNSHASSYQAQQQDSFCATAAYLQDGTLLITGGNSRNGGYGNGATIFDPANNVRTTSAASTALPRWYSTMLTLPDSRQLVIGGMKPYTERMVNNPEAAIANGEPSMTPEILENGNWRSLFGAYSRDAFGPDYLRTSIPHAFVAPNGQVFGISADKMWYLDANANNGNGSTRTVGDFKRGPGFMNDPVNTGALSVAVMYDVGKIIQAGGNGGNNGDGYPASNMATVIDISGGQPVLSEQSRMNFPRRYGNGIVLATGEVVITGGTKRGNNGGGDAVYEAEIWNPDTGNWTVGARASRIRVYHSQTSLLPNGAILSTGGGTPGPVLNLNGEIFYPPYLFELSSGGSVLAKRPVIEAVSGLSYDHNSTLQLDMESAEPIRELALLGLSNGTHSFNSGQRRIPLPVAQEGIRVTTTTPNANLAPPGYYQLVAINESGVPSYGVIVSIGGNMEPPQVATTPYTPPSQTLPISFPVIGAGATANYTFDATDEFTYSWNFGDGSPSTSFSSVPDVEHQFNSPGLYFVTLATKDAQGIVKYQSYYQAVATESTPLQPTQSSTIAVQRSSGHVWNVNPDNNTVSVSNGTQLVREIAVGNKPQTLAITDDGRVWVANKADASVTIIDSDSYTVMQTVALASDSQPHGIAAAPDGEAVYIALEATGELVKLGTDGQVDDKMSIGNHARHVAVAADSSSLLVSRFISPPLPGESTLLVNTNLATAEVVVVNAESMSVEQRVTLRNSDKQDNAIQGAGIPNYLGAAAIAPDGTRAWIPSKQDNIARGSARNGQNLDFQNTVRAISSVINLDTLEEDYRQRVDHDNASLASATSYHPSGVYAFVALETSREVAIMDAVTGSELFRFEVGLAPQGLALSADGFTLYVHEFMQRSVSSFDLSSLLLNGQPTVQRQGRVSTVSTETLSAQVLLGKQLFYDAKDPRLSRDSYMSCATCHNDGGHDGRTWDFSGFGEGLRNTIALTGRAAIRHGNLHWSANFDELQDFEGQIRSLGGGTGLMNNADFNAESRNQPLGTPKAGVSADLDNLAAYVTSLNRFAKSPYASSDGQENNVANAGKTLFDENCSECHSGNAFTRSASISEAADIGTLLPSSGKRLDAPLTGIDVPTLLDVWATAPYLHDGSAATITEAIVAHDGAQLDRNQLNQVATYVQQLGGNSHLAEENIAAAATLETSYVSPWESLAAVNDGQEPRNSADQQFGAYGNWSGAANYGQTNSITLRWDNERRLLATEVYWWNDSLGIATPNAAQLEYWDGASWQSLGPIGTELNRFNRVEHDVSATALRISMSSVRATGILEVRVLANQVIANPTTGPNSGPQITLQDTERSRYSTGEVVLLAASANDLDGSISRVEFYSNGLLLGSDLNYPYRLEWTDAPSGEHQLMARAFDNDGAYTDSEFTSVTVDTENRAPVANDLVVSGNQNAAIPIELAATDEDNDTLVFTVVEQPSSGLLIGTPPSLSYRPFAEFVGVDNFTYRVNDGDAESSIASVQISVLALPANNAPVAQNSSRATQINTAINIQLRATDEDNDELTYTLVQMPSSGTLGGQPPALVYTPDSGFAGEDKFTYIVHDATQSSNTGTVSIRVSTLDIQPSDAVSNEALTIELDGSLADWSDYQSFGADRSDDVTTEDTLNWLEAWLAHDGGYFYLAYRNAGEIVSTWGQTIYLDIDDNLATGYANGLPLGADYVIQGTFVYSYNGNGQEWSWVYQGELEGTALDGVHEYRLPRSMLGDPDILKLAFVGSNEPYNGVTEDLYPDTIYDDSAANRSFTYLATRPENSAPTVRDQQLVATEGQALGLVLQADDFEGDVLVYTVSEPVNGFTSGEPPELTYLPNTGFTGIDQFTYTANDGTLDSNTATVTITVASHTDSAVPSNPVNEITLDGYLNEWDQVKAFPDDPLDITDTTINRVDFRKAAMAHSTSSLYLNYQLEGPEPLESIESWVLNVYFDTDDNSGTGYQISSASGADYLLQGHELYEYSGAAGGWGWTALGTVPYVSNGVIAEMAIDRAIIGDPSLLNVVLIGDNASLIVPGNQEDLYPDTLNDNASSQRAFSYNTGGNASSPSTTPLSAPTVTSDVIVTSSRLRYVNAIQPSADTLRQTTGAARTATSTVSTGGSASIIMIFLNLLLWISRAAARGSVFVSEQRQGRHGQVFDKA